MERKVVVDKWLDWIRDFNVFPPRYQDGIAVRNLSSFVTGNVILDSYKRTALPEKDERFNTDLFLNLLLLNEEACKQNLIEFYKTFWPQYTYDGVNFNTFQLEKNPQFSKWLFNSKNVLMQIYLSTFPEIEKRVCYLNELREGEYLKSYLLLYIQMAYNFYFF